MIRAVTIDFWNTLVDSSNGEERKRVRYTALAEAFAEKGYSYSQEEAAEGFRVAMQMFDDSWLNKQRTLSAYEILAHVFAHLNVELTEATHRSLADIFARSILLGMPGLLDGAAAVLARLSERYKLAIISDTALSPGTLLREVLRRHGIKQYFSSFVFSDETGVAKPHKEAFRQALAPFGVDPSEAVHVGDIEQTDIAGAKDYGMKAILFRGDVHSPSYKKFDGITRADAIAMNWNETEGIIAGWDRV